MCSCWCLCSVNCDGSCYPFNGFSVPWLSQSLESLLSSTLLLALENKKYFFCLFLPSMELSHHTLTHQFNQLCLSTHIIIVCLHILHIHDMIKSFLCTPFACAIVFYGAFALISFMLMNRLQHYSFTKKSLNFKVLKLMLELCWLKCSMISIQWIPSNMAVLIIGVSG